MGGFWETAILNYQNFKDKIKVIKPKINFFDEEVKNKILVNMLSIVQ